MGRMELAQSYFPYIQPRSAWLKFKSLLLEDPDLSGFAKQRRRTFLPSEVNIIYQHLGHIWGTHRVPRFRGLERVLRALKHARTL